MKKSILVLAFLTLLVSCNGNNKSISLSSSSSNEVNNSSETNSSSSSLDDLVSTSDSSLSSSESIFESSSENSSISEEIFKEMSLNQIIQQGNALEENMQGDKVSFSAYYVKVMTDNNDKLMLFVDNSDYIYVRVANSDFKGYLENRYFNCLYNVKGTIVKLNNRVEVIYSSLNNQTSDPENIDYTNIYDEKKSIKDVYDEFELLTLNNKNNAVGKIVKIKGIIISTEYTDANKKVVIFDGQNVLTIVNDKAICAKDDVGKEYIFIGALSVLKGCPALWFLDSTFNKKYEISDIDLSISKIVKPSYFASYYNVSDKIKLPKFEDFSYLYKVSGYIKDNDDITTKYNLGIVDNYSDSLSDVGIKTSIKGIFLMNNLSLSEKDLTYSPYYEYANQEIKINAYVTLHQFDTQNHGWKVFGFDQKVEKA